MSDLIDEMKARKFRLAQLQEQSFFRGWQKGMLANVEHYLALRLKPKPRWMPEAVWKWVADKVVFIQKFKEVADGRGNGKS